jgi:phage-related protein
MTDVSLRYLLYGEDRSASKAVKEVEGAATRAGKVVGSSFSKMGSVIGGEVGEMLTRAGEGLSSLSESAKGMGPKLAAGGAAVAGLGTALSVLGSKDKEAHNALQAALGATGQSIDDYKEGIEETIKKQEGFAHSAADTQQALATLTEITGDGHKAIESMAVVADLAAAKHIKLQDAATMVGKGLEGNSRLFKQYGIELKKNKDGTVDMDGAMSQLSAKLQGQASASVDSFSGRLRVMKTRAEDAVAQFGQKFGPAMQIAGVTVAAVGMVMQVMATRQLVAAAATEAETVAVEEQAGASKLAAAAQWLLNAAMEANPIGLIIVAIVALVAAFVLLWTHSETFRRIVTAAFDAVKGAALAAFGWIKDHWPLLLAILTGPVGIAVLMIVTHWKQIKSTFGDALDGIRGLWGDFMGFLRGLPGKIGSALGGMWNGISGGFKGVLNDVIDIWNSMPSFKIPSITIAGKTIGGGTISLPHLSHVATGGVMTSSGAVVLGEHGREIVDMPAGARVRPLSAMDTHSSSGGSSDGVITLVVKTETGEQIDRKLVKVKRTTGRKLEFELI